MSSDMQAAFQKATIAAETFVRQIRQHESVDSTNNAALASCQTDRPQLPLLVLATRQTAGRGRGSNAWWSTHGALTFSLVIQPADLGIDPHLWPQASLTSGLAVCCAVDELLPHDQVLLKWPNDVYVRNRKVAGVLVELGPRANGTMVIGIGVNVNNTWQNAPAELQEIGTSLQDVTGQSLCLNQVLIAILRQLERQLTRLGHRDEQLAADWQRRCALAGKNVQIVSQGRHTTGACQGIDADGALLLQTADGLARFFSGVVAKSW
ncbi:MAG: biotin--[acetyl-CoA-carboxylase] ligase [Planctomycetales bacterium]|nr:biotin--[acetyl-CoA-carboxylase] ligase [Planctomycetales bacterium]NIM09222.1 biotin--[acetyl-CoA-carboxylase] ligase [Planctomycetales bacterium]NIN08693.1 biotin--[acetyl-CoA-carboxylase] ligase [Planctomycetales bacterium]NIN77808.1 biotin--[acetyl-CoA-carboxylase] ligase [Planctomycetales bacterium]NIO34985.1 biotin--[acetyl-CoA-carboxylase] ligase [Planctomycetales bacterium]